MSDPQPNNPLHGVTLKQMLEALHARLGWEGLAQRVRVTGFATSRAWPPR
jgi:uncharacterized protein (DUF2132 family)